MLINYEVLTDFTQDVVVSELSCVHQSKNLNVC